MKRILALLFLLKFTLVAQVNQPKLVVGIVVDQMRYDYINRYWDDFSERGFKKLLAQGYNCSNTQILYHYLCT